MKIDLIDTGRRALATAQKLAEYHGIEKQVRLINDNLVSLGEEFGDRYDIALLIGILCPLEYDDCRYVLKQIKSTFKKEALLIMSNASKVMGDGNPVSQCREKVFGWKLIYKNERDLERISKSNGFEMREYFYDDFMQNVMITVQKKQDFDGGKIWKHPCFPV